MTKSIAVERQSHSIDSADFDTQVKKFLDEFAIKDSENITQERHDKLMLSCFYWVDKKNNQGYHIPDDLEIKKRKLTFDEYGILDYLFFDATVY